MLSPIARLGGHDRHVRRAAFSPDGARFALASSTGRIAIYSRDGELLSELPALGRTPFVQAIAWSPDDRLLATVEGHEVRLRSTQDLSLHAELVETATGPLAFCDSGLALACVCGKGGIRIFEVSTRVERGALSLDPGGYQVFDVDGLIADPHGSFIAASDNGGYSENELGGSAGHGSPVVTLIDASSAKAVRTIEPGRPAAQLELDVSRKRLLVVAYTGIGIWDLAGARQQLWQPYADRERNMGSAHIAAHAIAACEPWLATVPELSFTKLTLDFWDPLGLRKLWSSDALSQLPDWLAASPDGSRLLAPGPDGVQLWDVSRPASVQPMP